MACPEQIITYEMVRITFPVRITMSDGSTCTVDVDELYAVTNGDRSGAAEYTEARRRARQVQADHTMTLDRLADKKEPTGIPLPGTPYPW